MNNDKNQPAKTTNEVANVSTKKDYLDASNISRIENLVEALKDSTLAKQFVERFIKRCIENELLKLQE